MTRLAPHISERRTSWNPLQNGFVSAPSHLFPAGHGCRAETSPARPATWRRSAKPEGFASRTAPAPSSSHPEPKRRAGDCLHRSGPARGVPPSWGREPFCDGGTLFFRVHLACGPP